MRRTYLGLVVASSLVFGGLAVAIPATTAGATGTALLTESFMNSATSSSGWQMPTGSSGVCLTAGTATTATPVPDCDTSPVANGSGDLQLTTNGGSKVGTIYNSVALPTANGLDVTWDSYQYDGTSSTGADGISFDLASVNPSDPVPPSTVGPSGGSLGYSTISADSPAGVPFGYLGFGADVFGNFENGGFGSSTCAQATSAVPESMGVRGPGDAGSGYCLLGQVNLTGTSTLDDEAATTPTGFGVPEEVVINPGTGAVTATASSISVPGGDYLFATEPLVSDAAGTVWHYFEGTLPTNPVDVPSNWLNSAGLPKELAFGWASSTGGSNEYHAINLLTASSLTAAPSLALTNTDSGSLSVGTPGTVTLTASVAGGSAASESDAPVVSDTFPASLTPGTASGGANWTCTTTGQLVSCTYTGTLPLTAGTALPAISVPVTPTTSGAFSNTANVSSADAAPATTLDTGTISLVPQSITFTNTPPTSPLPGSTYTVSATGGLSGNAVTFTRDSSSTTLCAVNSSTGLVTLTTAGTCIVDANQSGNSTYAAATQQQQTVTAVMGAQTIVFTNTPPTNPLPGTTYTVTATGGLSGNPVTFTRVSPSTTLCTVNSSTGLVTLTLTPGTCVVDAQQLGNAAYSVAPQVQQTVDTVAGTQTINFTNSPPASPLVGTTYTVTATGGASANPVTFSVDHTSTSGCTVNSSTGVVTLTAPVGTCVIDANQTGNGVYTAATQVQQTVSSRSLTPQSIIFTNTPPSSPTIDTTYTVTATGGGSGNPVTFSVDPLSTSGCTVNATTGLVTLTAPAGTCVIDANEPGNSNFAAAGKATQSVTSVVPAGDPVAAITSPSSGRFYVVGKKVPTTYKCSDPNGPGIATCSDGTSSDGNGTLKTSSLGEHTYVVTATSKDGQTTTTRIRYKVVPPSVSLTIYFPNNSWVLSPTAMNQLNGFASAVGSDGFSSVSVNGYASSTGLGANNHTLGVQRARAAWSYLQTRFSTLSVSGVAATLRGLGATHFKVTPSSAAQNRRTVLTAK
jgi:outer membrane protein OmpA-like peptidoglycan-associated protein